VPGVLAVRIDDLGPYNSALAESSCEWRFFVAHWQGLCELKKILTVHLFFETFQLLENLNFSTVPGLEIYTPLGGRTMPPWRVSP
jgi:hypothetical protein